MRRTLTSALMGVLVVAGLWTGSATAASLSAEDKADLARVEAYFNGITSMRSNFLQASSTGLVAKGRVWLRRPGRMRFEYDPPSPIFITSDGILVTYQDLELKQTNQIPLFTSPLSVLVEENVTFGEELIVDEVKRESNVLRVRIRQRKEPDQGYVTLVFQDRPMSLKQWTIVDAQQVSVKVALLDPEFGVTIPNELFRPKDLGRPGDEVGR
jgi:outer membrane lipoprotein-sorting protein